MPAHWSVPRIKTVCRVDTGHTPSRKVAAYWEDCTIPWFTLADVHQLRGDRRKYVFETSECVSELGIANSSARRLPAGTVILSRTASVGFSGILDRDMATSQDFMAWVPGPSVVGEFLLYVLRAMRPEFRRLMHGSTHNTIYMPTLHAFRMPLPPRDEQSALVRHLDEATSTLDSAIDTASRETELIEAYRITLVADVVTGKVDVRDAAAHLPNEIDEELALDDIESLVEDEESGEGPSETPLEEVGDEP